MITDSGVVLEEEFTMSSFIKESSTTLVFDKNSDFFWDLRVSISNLKDIYSRKYIKLQGIFAVSGGFIKIIVIIACFINNYLTGLVFYDDILQQSFKNYELTLIKKRIFTESSVSSRGHVRQASKSIDLKVPSEEINLQDSNTNKLHQVKKTKKKSRENSAVTKKEGYMMNNLKIKPMTCTDVVFYYCKNPGSSSLRKFETLYEDVMDVNRIFFSLNKLEMIEKIMLPDKEQRYLKRIAVHKNIIRKIAIEDDHAEEMEVDEKKFEKILSTARKTQDNVQVHINTNLIKNFD